LPFIDVIELMVCSMLFWYFMGHIIRTNQHNSLTILQSFFSIFFPTINTINRQQLQKGQKSRREARVSNSSINNNSLTSLPT
jgi:fucose permease